MPLVPLCEMVPGQEADLFVLMTAKEQLTTREGKPYFKVAFRDRGREVSFPIWDNSPWAAECQKRWNPGVFYKLRAVYRETNYGPQLDIRKIREVIEADAADGFDPALCLPQSRLDPQAMFAQLTAIVAEQIDAPPLRALVESILRENRELLLRIPAARHNHHAFVAGWLEHTLSVTQTAVYLAEKYARVLSGPQAAAGPRHGGGRGHPPRHRQAPRVGTAAGRDRLHGRGRADRPHAPGPRHRPRGGGRHAAARRPPAAAGAPDHRPPAVARVGLAQAADDARGPVGPLCRRHRRQVFA